MERINPERINPERTRRRKPPLRERLRWKNIREACRLRNLSLWKAFLLLTVAALLWAAVMLIILTLFWENLRSSLMEPYYLDYEIAPGFNTTIIDHEAFEQRPTWVRIALQLEEFGFLASFIVIPTVALFTVVTVFYRLKLKKPIQILQESAAKIARSDLDFRVEYAAKDEMAELCGSFEAMRAQLEKNNRETWRAMEERRRQNAAFAHDLRTPITVLKGYADLLAAYLPEGRISEEKLLSTVKCMSDSVKRLEAYVGTMGELQRLEDIQIAPEGLSAAELAGQLAASTATLAAQAGKTCVFRTEMNGERIYADQRAVFRVAENLAANALRYAAGEISVVLSGGGGELTLSVGDNGRGFSQEELRMAAAPFFKDSAGGEEHWGLGLNICAVLCKKCGGELLLANGPIGAVVTAQFCFSTPADS